MASGGYIRSLIYTPVWRGGPMTEPHNKSDMDLAVETFVDRIEELYPNIHREGFHNAISEYVHNNVPDEGGGEQEHEERGLIDKAKDKLPGQ